MLKHSSLLLVIGISIFLSTGCMTIQEYDAEKLEYDQINKVKKAQKKKEDPFVSEKTADYVKVKEEDDVVIEAVRSAPIEHRGVKLDVWVINGNNKSSTPKCVTIDWRLQDFTFETSLPYEFLIDKNAFIKIGKMTQTIWAFDDVAIAIPPSGYINEMRVRDADYEKTTNRLTCDTLEEDIQTPEEKDTLEL